MKYIQTLLNLQVITPFEKGPNDTILVTDPKNIVFRGQKLVTVTENPEVKDPSMMPYEPMRNGENVILSEVPSQAQIEYIANCYGIVYKKGTELCVKIPIQYNKSKTKAYIYIFPDASGKLPNVEEINAVSYYLGIKQQLPSEQIKSSLDLLKPQELLKTRIPVRILLASGYEAQDGWTRYFILKVNPEVKSGEIRDDGRIDYKERGFIHEIQKGTPIAEEIPGQEANDGIDIYGETIKGRTLKKKEYKLGKNIEPDSANPLIHVSAINGSLSVRPPYVEINERVYLTSDIDYATGNIDFNGTVEIKGNIKSGFKVTAGGDCIIHENIDEGQVQIKGDLFVKGGIHGSEKAPIFIGGSVSAKYIRNGYIQCEGDIFVEDSIINSKIMCRGKVTVQSKKSGRIIGGEIIGKNGILVNTVGSQTGTDTFLGARMDPEISEKIAFEQVQLKELLDSKKQTSETIYQSFGAEFMTKPQEYIKSLPAFRKKQCLQLLQDLNNVNHKVKDLQFTIEELRGKLRTPDDAKIEIVQNLFPPTRIQLKDSIVKIEKKESHTTFRVPPGRAEIEVIYS